jgi:CelD/BcsL family acetyltransferase involved in cellulose biosynthesis
VAEVTGASTEARVLAVLRDIADSNTARARWASADTIAALASMRRRSARRALERLDDAGKVACRESVSPRLYAAFCTSSISTGTRTGTAGT